MNFPETTPENLNPEMEEVYSRCLKVIADNICTPHHRYIREDESDLNEEKREKNKLRILYTELKLSLELLENEQKGEEILTGIKKNFLGKMIESLEEKKDKEDIKAQCQKGIEKIKTEIINSKKPEIKTIIKIVAFIEIIELISKKIEVLDEQEFKNYLLSLLKKNELLNNERENAITIINNFLNETIEIIKKGNNRGEVKEKIKQYQGTIEKIKSKITDKEKMKIENSAKEKELILEIAEMLEEQGMPEEFIRDFLLFLAKKMGEAIAKAELSHKDYILIAPEVELISRAFEYACVAQGHEKILFKYREDYYTLKKETTLKTYDEYRPRNILASILKYINEKISKLLTKQSKIF